MLRSCANQVVLCSLPTPLSLDAYDMAKLLCDKYYLASPELEIQEVNGES